MVAGGPRRKCGRRSPLHHFTIAKTALLGQIDSFRASLEAKKAKTTEFVPLETGLDGADLVASLEVANAEIRKHNGKTANFKAAKDAARNKLETHYLSTIYDEVKRRPLYVVDETVGLDEPADAPSMRSLTT